MNGNVLYTLLGITFIIAVTGLIIAGLHENRIKTETVEFKFSAVTNGSKAKVTFKQPKDTVLLNEVVVIPTAEFNNGAAGVLDLKLGTADDTADILSERQLVPDGECNALDKDEAAIVYLNDPNQNDVISKPLATKTRTVHATLLVDIGAFTTLSTVKVMFKFGRFD